MDKSAPILALLLFQLTSIAADLGCPPGTVYVPDDNGLGNKWKCFLFATYPQQYLTAERACMNNNGHLTSIHNQFMNNLLAQAANDAFGINDPNTKFYVGINNLTGTGWQNVDDESTAVFTDWGANEPNFIQGNQCVFLDFYGFWYNGNCFDRYPYICEVPQIETTTTPAPTTPPPACDSGWILVGTTCYQLIVQAGTSINMAQMKCATINSKLASIHDSLTSETVGDKLVSFDTPNPVIGLCSNYYTGSGPISWQWLDQSTVDFLFWAPNEPSTAVNITDYCTTIGMDGKWSTFDATQLVDSFICAKPSS